MSARHQIERTLGRDIAGMLSADEVRDEIATIVARAIEDRDPELLETMALALENVRLRYEDIGGLAWTAYRAEILGMADRQVANGIRDLFNRHVIASLGSERDPEERARLLGLIPPQWCERAWLVQVIESPMDQTSRLSAIHHLLEALRHHESDVGAWRIAVEPNLSTKEPAAVRLIAAAYLCLQIDQRRGHGARNYLLEHTDDLDADLLLELGTRLSIEVLDEPAVLFARSAMTTELAARRFPIAAAVLWIAGERDEAIAALRSFDAVEQDWWTTAARSLAQFIRAKNSLPAEQLKLLTNPPSENLIKQPATVGALVGRLAFLRMQAQVNLGNPTRSLSEAQAVVTAHRFREYSLHGQERNFEFDVRLVDRLAVTPDELHEARTLIATSTHGPAAKWFVFEGQLIQGAAVC